MKILVLFLLLQQQLLKAGKVWGVGLVPDGPHTSDLFAETDVEAAIDICDNELICAGITYKTIDTQNNPDPDVYYHAFIPPLLNDPTEPGWTTHRSTKPFILQPGRVVPKNPNTDILNIPVDPSMTTWAEARQICKNNPKCVAFSYPVHSLKLTGFESLHFYSSIDSMADVKGDYWRTFIANDEKKADRVNPDAVTYNEDMSEEPYGRCCDRAVLNNRTNTPIMPTIQDIKQVDTLTRILCNISQEEFLEKYEFTRTPVILVGCDKDWPAKTKWTVDQLVNRFDKNTQWRSRLHFGRDYAFRYKVNWWVIADAIKKNQFYYVFDDLTRPGRESLKEDYETPGPFQGTEMYPEDFPPNEGKLRWFSMGIPGTGTLAHMDPFGTDAWNSLIVGHKWWIIYPPDATGEDSHQCDPRCTPEQDGYENQRWYMSIAVNSARTPFGRHGRTPIHVLQKPGETIYVPFGYLHSVLNMDHPIAITANYGSPANLQLVWENVLREGTEEQWKWMYYERFNDEQRKAVREGEIWPPENFAGQSRGDSWSYLKKDTSNNYDDGEL